MEINNAIKHVLFFDDEPFKSKILSQNLNLNQEFEVTLVNDIDNLFEELTFRTIPFDIIILDIMAPVPNSECKHIRFTESEISEMETDGTNTGIVLAKRIWELNTYKNIPILFLSARLQSHVIQSFKNDGKRCDWQRKPILANELIRVLNNL